MRVIGITGPSGSGKSAVSEILLKKGAVNIDADKIAHDIILNGTEAYYKLVDYFGSKIVGDDGEILRRKLGNIVFADGGEKLKFLNDTTHKYIFDEMERQIKEAEKNGASIVIIDAPLLIEGKFITLAKEIWAVHADKNVQVKRIMQRDGITQKEAENRLSRQKPWSTYAGFATKIIDNSTDLNNLEKEVERALES
ncbi:MAG: dephospho-CoA kinase [Clostridia bacterium]|jgi:dephospho-CoA kinase|nr:dephospho-CoA kinase [Clostridia bacterium]MCI1958917.1 dephospho-CoA kinase [Clostridia bacterium]MCI2000238.1 dephospho-CoA kinase [Clostridia bacterium]MCI2014597.1 dephospho-CoA kinase [Clostridia bacterium]